MSEKKYLICPGNVRSINDNQVHYITAGQLMNLYKVKPEECVIYNEKTGYGLQFKGLRSLGPKYNGDYSL